MFVGVNLIVYLCSMKTIAKTNDAPLKWDITYVPVRNTCTDAGALKWLHVRKVRMSKEYIEYLNKLK